MAPPQDVSQWQAEDAAFSQQYDAQQAAQKQQEGQQAPPAWYERFTAPLGRVTTQALDGAVSAADTMYNTEPMKKARDVAAGAITGATNIADAAVDAARAPNIGNDFAGAPSSPIWDHAKQHILDFRDAVAVSDPSLADNLVQSVAQLAVPFAGYSRALAGLHGAANMLAAGAATDATALGPHDMRMADLFALGRHTEGKLGAALKTLAPDGSALNAYVNFLADRTNESEAEGRFKNVLDGLGANLLSIPLMHGAGVVLKQGTTALRNAVGAGVSKVSDLMPPKALAAPVKEK